MTVYLLWNFYIVSMRSQMNFLNNEDDSAERRTASFTSRIFFFSYQLFSLSFSLFPPHSRLFHDPSTLKDDSILFSQFRNEPKRENSFSLFFSHLPRPYSEKSFSPSLYIYINLTTNSYPMLSARLLPQRTSVFHVRDSNWLDFLDLTFNITLNVVTQ